MPGEVRLNLPPRVIESARAAQYANRARLDARATDNKIQARTVQQRQAAQRQAGLILPAGVTTQTQTQRGRAVMDPPEPLEAPRIWRRWRVVDAASFGVAYIANWYTGDFFSGYLFPRRIYSGDGSAYLEIYRDRSIKPASPVIGTRWNDRLVSDSPEPVREVYSISPSPSSRMEYTGTEVAGWSVLPAGSGNAVIVYSHVDFYSYYGVTGSLPSSLQLVNGPEGTALVQRAFVVGRSSIREIAVGSGFRSFVLSVPPPWTSVRYVDLLGVTIGVIRQTLNDSIAAWLRARPFSTEFLTSVSDPIFNNNAGFYVNDPNVHMQAFIRSRFGDIDSGGDARLRGFGPGVYAYIKNPAVARAAFDAAGSGLWQKEAAAESVIGYGLPPSLADSTVTPGFALSYQGPYPPASNAYPPVNGADAPQWERQDEPITYAPFSTIDVTVGTTPQAIPIQKVLLWDWGDPAYCRRQLLDLGFAEQDLTP